MDPSLPLAVLAVVVPVGAIVAGIADSRSGRGIGMMVSALVVLAYAAFTVVYLARTLPPPPENESLDWR